MTKLRGGLLEQFDVGLNVAQANPFRPTDTAGLELHRRDANFYRDLTCSASNVTIMKLHTSCAHDPTLWL